MLFVMFFLLLLGFLAPVEGLDYLVNSLRGNYSEGTTKFFPVTWHWGLDEGSDGFPVNQLLFIAVTDLDHTGGDNAETPFVPVARVSLWKSSKSNVTSPKELVMKEDFAVSSTLKFEALPLATHHYFVGLSGRQSKPANLVGFFILSQVEEFVAKVSFEDVPVGRSVGGEGHLNELLFPLFKEVQYFSLQLKDSVPATVGVLNRGVLLKEWTPASPTEHIEYALSLYNYNDFALSLRFAKPTVSSDDSSPILINAELTVSFNAPSKFLWESHHANLVPTIHLPPGGVARVNLIASEHTLYWSLRGHADLVVYKGTTLVKSFPTDPEKSFQRGVLKDMDPAIAYTAHIKNPSENEVATLCGMVGATSPHGGETLRVSVPFERIAGIIEPAKVTCFEVVLLNEATSLRYSFKSDNSLEATVYRATGKSASSVYSSTGTGTPVHLDLTLPKYSKPDILKLCNTHQAEVILENLDVEMVMPTPTTPSEAHHNLALYLGIGLGAGGAVCLVCAVLIIVVCVVCCVRKKKKKGYAPVDEVADAPEE